MTIFDGFDLSTVRVGAEIDLRVRVGGTGPPVVLLHGGHPRTHTTWHAVAPRLVAAGHTVVCRNLRGYGQSSKPPTTPDHSPYSKRFVAADIRSLMERLGHPQFSVVGQSPGVGHRRGPRMGKENHADFVAAISNPATVRAMLEDYRAGLGVDRAADDADRAAGRKIGCPAMVLWSTGDDLGDLYGDVMGIWRSWADQLSGGPIESGHHMAEDAPEELADRLARFFAQP